MNITTDIKPKRGRKKKIDVDIKDTMDSAIMVKDAIDVAATETAISVPIEPPKKRGRKKKIVITEIVDDLKKITISESEKNPVSFSEKNPVSFSEKNPVSFSEKNPVERTISHSIYSRFLNLSITDRCYFYYLFQDVMKIEKYEKDKIYLLQFTFAYISFENDEYILPVSDVLELKCDNYLQYNNSKIYINHTNIINNPNQSIELKFKKIIIFYNLYPYTDWTDHSYLLENILRNNLLNDNFILDNSHVMNLKFNINGKTITFRELLKEM
jgi:hypothetical protein